MNHRTLLPLLALTATLHAADWPQYNGPATDRTTPEKITHVWMSTGPKILWKMPSTNGFSSFAVAGARCFMLEGREVDGAPQEVLVARDANTGQEGWTAPLGAAKYDGGGNDGTGDNKGGDGPRSTPTTDGAHVFTMSAKLVLQSFDAATGKELWKKDLMAEFSGRNIQWQNAASPLLDGGLLYVAGDIVYCSAGYGIGAGAAKIAKNGDQWTATEIYRMRGNKPLANHWSTPVLFGGHLYGMFSFKEYAKGSVKCVDIKDGSVKWEQPGFGAGQVILAGDKVLALSDAGEIVLIDPQPAAYKELARTKVIEG